MDGESNWHAILNKVFLIRSLDQRPERNEMPIQKERFPSGMKQCVLCLVKEEG